MIKDIIGSAFEKDEQIYVFERDFGIFIENLGYDEEYGEELYLVLFEEDKDEVAVRSCSCFRVVQSEMMRTWSLNASKVNLCYTPVTGTIHLLYLGDPITVFYDNKRDCETFRKGDRLHNDWEGRGIQFNVLIDKWLRRLNGEIIPLSDYYHDPVNRWLDGLTD